MTITEQIRLKLKTVDRELRGAYTIASGNVDTSVLHQRLEDHIDRARRILREICELDGESEE